MKILFELIGGLGLFLYGMTIMGDGLEKSAGDKMKKIIEVLTSNRFVAVGLGALVTMIIQSSSATTVMVVGFVNAGIMNLVQATGVIMGANIGTTITAQVASLELNEIAPIVVGLSVGVWIFTNNKRIKNIAEVFIGFGILFIGMDYMKNAVRPLREYEGFTTMLKSFGEPTFIDSLKAIFTGFFITAVVQSSSATTGILIALASEGLLPIEASLPILFGTNIGTCVTAMLSSIGANKTAKRAALIHFIFNVTGTLIFILFFKNLTIDFVVSVSKGDPARQLANTHTLFNIANTVMLIPFITPLVKIANKLIPVEESEKIEQRGIQYLDDRMLETPTIAIVQVKKEVINMASVALESYQKSMEAFFNKSEKAANETFKIEKVINSMERDITAYLIKLSKTTLAGRHREVVDGLFNTINDIERVGDHADNLAEQAMYRIDNKLEFSELATKELQAMYDKVMKAYKKSIIALKESDLRAAKKVLETEGEIDYMEKSLRASHIERLNKQQCVLSSGIIFLDIISNLERIGDHSSNIALAVIDTISK